jgi:uncharacterized protein (TIGR02246 family)
LDNLSAGIFRLEEHSNMRRIRIIAVVLAALSISFAAAAQSTEPGGEEAAVRAVTAREIDGWAKFDAVQVAACYTADTTWQNPFGVRIHSRATLQNFLTNLFQRPGYRSAKDTTAPHITDVRILSPTSAVVWSEEKSEGQIDDATGKPMAPRYSHYLEVFVKKDGAWLVSDSIIMDEYPR